jgi:hypothetical protein
LLTKEVVQRLIEQELNKSEEEGMQLFGAYSNGIISQEEYENRLKTLRGYGVWWGAEAACSLHQAEINHTKRLENGLYEISATCDMVLTSSHRTYGFDGTEEWHSKAMVIMKIDNALAVKEFDFQWAR